ncbi:MAG: MBL fold metallo-hydrolase [Synergistaceae bacterium]|nr:MBL fold metallo-hydrolase [Synergistaceae bacterium]
MNTKEIIKGLTEIILPVPRGGFESFIIGWHIDDKTRGRTILMETGPASSVPQLVEDLKHIKAGEPDYLLYTHIHLDHSGGAGQFHQKFPGTKIIAPIKGRPHLIDPTRLVEGSRENLGDLCDVYGMPVPLPEEALADPDIELDGLQIIDTPGHAPHHSSYLYELNGTRILFPGEAAGCYFELPDGSVFMRPATPHKFFYETAMESLRKLIDLGDVDLICYPHSGCSRDPKGLLAMAEKQMAFWKDIISALPADADTEDGVNALLKHDPVLAQIGKMSEKDRGREAFFLRQSVDGYLGYVRRNAHNS